MMTDVFPAAPLPVNVEAVPQGAMEGGNALRRMQDSHGFATAIAVQEPRSLAKVEQRVLQEARLLGDHAFYSWQVKDKGTGRTSLIEGASVKLATMVARNWGNCAVDALPVQAVDGAWIFTAAFIDLETGFTLTRQFRQSMESVVYGNLDAERKADIRFQIGQSKAARNVIGNALPAGLIDRAMAEAKKGVREQVQAFIDKDGIEKARELMLKALKKQGVTQEQVLRKMERDTTGGLTVDDLVVLKGDLTALVDGAERAGSLFPQPEGESAADLRERCTDSTRAKTEKPKKAEPKPKSEAAPPPGEPETGDAEDNPELLRKGIAALWDEFAPTQLKEALRQAHLTRFADVNTLSDGKRLREIYDVFAAIPPEPAK